MSNTNTSNISQPSQIVSHNSHVSDVKQPKNKSYGFVPFSLYVGELNMEVTEAMLYQVFSRAGDIYSIRVCRDQDTQRSLGYAYVNFIKKADAEKALKTMNFTLLNGKPCRVMWSFRDPSLRRSGAGNIFIKNLHPDVTQKDLIDAFSHFGPILSCKISTTAEGESRGFGFVHFAKPEDGEKAIKELNGKELEGLILYVGKFKTSKQRLEEYNKIEFTTLYFRHFDENKTDDEIKALFEKVGKLKTFSVEKDVNGVRKGFGYVEYETHKDAIKAIKLYHENKEITSHESGFYLQRHIKSGFRMFLMNQEYQKKKLDPSRNVCLYIKNLAETVDKERLIKEFSPFGYITSVHIPVDRLTERPKGVAYVCFSTAEEASRAMTKMNRFMLDGKPLYVALHKTADRRMNRGQMNGYNMGKNMMGYYPGNHRVRLPYNRQMMGPPYQQYFVNPYALQNPAGFVAPNMQPYMYRPPNQLPPTSGMQMPQQRFWRYGNNPMGQRVNFQQFSNYPQEERIQFLSNALLPMIIRLLRMSKDSTDSRKILSYLMKSLDENNLFNLIQNPALLEERVKHVVKTISVDNSRQPNHVVVMNNNVSVVQNETVPSASELVNKSGELL